MEAVGVIGANYGDEGKGLATDYFASSFKGAGRDVVVVRSNGGAQAGHTVTRRDGARHVFRHIGSGSLQGARTHLSQFFLANPIMLERECRTFMSLSEGYLNIRAPQITIDPRALVTVPHDMLINQWLEMSRGSDRHGSCGMGINETMVRSSYPELRLTCEQLFSMPDKALLGLLKGLEVGWVSQRIKELGLTLSMGMAADLIREDWPQIFVDARRWFVKNVNLKHDSELDELGDVAVFEGAQGLGLDAVRGTLPHATNSRTGIHNMLRVCEEAGIPDLEPYYVTRVYNTRHGAGPLDCEQLGVPHMDHGCVVMDETNRPNKWQDSIRTEALSLRALEKRITDDLDDRSDKVTVSARIFVTHINAIGSEGVRYRSWADSKPRLRESDDFLRTLMRATGLDQGCFSFGKTCGHVTDSPDEACRLAARMAAA